MSDAATITAIVVAIQRNTKCRMNKANGLLGLRQLL
jgi:hypothetical protein